MKYVASRPHSFARRPHYQLSEIERICGEALKSTGLLPDGPQPIRIDRFIEKRFKVSPRYEPLPEGVLGFTEFGPAGAQAIVISSALDQEGGKISERRIRTTLAHEGGHGLLHAHLFALGERPRSLFEDDGNRPEILCRDVQGESKRGRAYDGRWWEYQANRAIGGLLLPAGPVRIAVRPFCGVQGRLGIERLRECDREQAVGELAEIFDVNPAVARIRLGELFPAAAANQML